ncbi:hypothetical protein EJ110_NYTH38549 [Nymphaea thermarum]|nr:hypothetical protein EJ110_NYTH38549 [Nymphaea thermarum]
MSASKSRERDSTKINDAFVTYDFKTGDVEFSCKKFEFKGLEAGLLSQHGPDIVCFQSPCPYDPNDVYYGSPSKQHPPLEMMMLTLLQMVIEDGAHLNRFQVPQ